MAWIILSLIYAITNAVYTTFNSKHHYNGYVLGVWRGFGIFLLSLPFLFSLPLDISLDYWLVLIMQGIMIGIYDSHLFFATGRYGTHASSGFMATTVWITALLWWGIDFAELKALIAEPIKLMTLMFILCGFSVSYWRMMRVHVSLEAERYLYPAVFALALMSIATRYIALNGGSAYAGVVYYLTIACFVSGVYNLVGFLHAPRNKNKLEELAAPLKNWNGVWLVGFSMVLITAKTLALRLADNPAYVVAMLLLSPMFAEVIQTRKLIFTIDVKLVLFFLLALLVLVI